MQTTIITISCPQPFVQIAICVTGMFRTLDKLHVQRSLQALTKAFPTADVFTAVGLRADSDTIKGGNTSRSFEDVERVFDYILAPGQRVVHHRLSIEEESWSR